MNDKYLQYELADFLADDSFVNWVLDGTNEAAWQQWLSNNEVAAEPVNEARLLTKQLRFKEDVQGGDKIKEQIWHRIDGATQAKEVTLVPRRRWLYGVASTAAIALLVLWMLPDRSTTINTGLALETLTLPANSEVQLSTTSRLSYKKKNWSSQREVDLAGQAHFKVSKGVPFKVHTENGTVAVLGTEFDVVSESRAFQVKVEEGKVSVSSDNYNRILTAGMAFYKNPIWEGTNGLTEAWRKDQMFFAFTDQPLSEVLRAFTFSYSNKFQTDDVNIDVGFTGFFDTTADRATSLQQILWTMNIDFEIINNEVVLSPRQ